jgi:hypothetical protein
MKSLQRRLNEIERKLEERLSPPGRMILRESTPEGMKYTWEGQPIRQDQIRAKDVIFIIVVDPLPDKIMARFPEGALEENSRRDAARNAGTESQQDQK